MVHRVRAAGILVEDERVLLVREGRLPSGEHYFIPPGGGLEGTDRSLHDCVVREIQEETGLRVVVGEPIFIKEFFEPQLDTHHVEIFFLVTRSLETTQVASPTRAAPDRAFFWFSQQDLVSLVVFPDDLKDRFWLDRARGDLRCRYLGRS